MPLADVTNKNKMRIWARHYENGDIYFKQTTFSVSAIIRISKTKGVFDRGIMYN